MFMKKVSGTYKEKISVNILQKDLKLIVSVGYNN